MVKLSFVIPCYNSGKTIQAVIDEIKATVRPEDSYEIICVDDNSTDDVLEVIRSLCIQDKNIKALCLSRNFGQHNALMAGFNEACGEVIIALDDDGQSPIGEVYRLTEKLKNGADVVIAGTKDKKHSKVKLIGSKLNELMSAYLIGTPVNMNFVPLYVFRSFIKDEIIKYCGSYTYILGLLYRSTTNIEFVEVTHRKRETGRSGYSFIKLLSLWMNGFTAFSIKPLRIATLMGVSVAAVGFSYGAYIVIKKLISPAVPIGYSSLMAALLFIGGMLMLMLGLIGEYVGRMYINQNNAPQYVVRERINIDVEF